MDGNTKRFSETLDVSANIKTFFEDKHVWLYVSGVQQGSILAERQEV